MKKILIALLFGIVLINLASAWEWDNIARYDHENPKIVYIVNALGFGKTIAKITLLTPLEKMDGHPNYVMPGKDRVVMIYEIELYDAHYGNALGDAKFYQGYGHQPHHGKPNKYQEAIYTEVLSPIYNKENCYTAANQTWTCEQEIIGYDKQNVITDWKKFNGNTLHGGNTTLGLTTDVAYGDYYDGIWTLFGVELDEHATWTIGLNNALKLYYKLDNSTLPSGLWAVENTFSHYNLTKVDANWTTPASIFDAGLIGNASICGGQFPSTSGFNMTSASNEWTINFWIKNDSLAGHGAFSHSFFGTKPNTAGNNNGTFEVWFSGVRQMVIRVHDNTGATSLQRVITYRPSQTPTITNWTMLSFIFNETNLRYYSNGTLLTDWKFNRYVKWTAEGNLTFGGGNAGFLGGMNVTNIALDEIGVWNRLLSDVELGQLYNDGLGITPLRGGGDPSSMSVQLDYPPNGFSTINQTLNFNATIIPSNTNVTNGTLFVWYTNTTLFNNTQTTLITGNLSNATTFNLSAVPFGDYVWNVFGCTQNYSGAVACAFNETNRSLSVRGASFSNSFFVPTVLETARSLFMINTTIQAGMALQTALLSYNFINYSADVALITGNQYGISRYLDIPALTIGADSENRTFYWTINFVETGTGASFQSRSGHTGQNTTQLIFQECGTVKNNISMLNFTMVDEITEVEINPATNATTFQGVFQYSFNGSSVKKNLTINNISIAQSRYNFCTNNITHRFEVNLESAYTAVNYADKNYFLNNATLTNVSNNINLYLLLDSDAVQFFITVLDGVTPVEGVTVSIAKYYTAEGLYKTVEIDETDSGGQITAYLELDKKYRFTLVKNGQLLGILERTSICQIAPCEIELKIAGVGADPFSNFYSVFAGDILYNLTFTQSTAIVQFDFIDLTGLATQFNLLVEQVTLNSTAGIICNVSVFSSSGALTCNVTGYSGDFIATGFVYRSPAVFINYITFVISSLAGELGILGVFVSLIIILVIIFSLSFSPTMLVLAVPLSLTVIKLMGIMTLSIGTLVVVYIFAFVAMWVIGK